MFRHRRPIEARNIARTAALATAALVCVAHAASAQRTPRIADVQIVPADAKLRVGEKAPFLATAYDAAGNPIDSVTFAWSSSNPDVASIDQGGIATGVSAGLAIITVRTGTGASARSSQAPVEVAAAGPSPAVQSPPARSNVEQQRMAPVVPSVARVTLLPADASLRIGELRPFLATAYDAAGNQMNGGAFQWSSSNPAVASVDQRGVVTGVGAGLTVISARTGAGDAMKSAEAPVQVGAAAAPAAAEAPSPAINAPAPLPASGAIPSGRPWLADTSANSSLDFAGARVTYQHSCAGGNVEACTNLGWLFLTGRGGGQDAAQARVLFQRGCDGADAAGGCGWLGYAYETGRGGGQDLGQAGRLFARSCDGGAARACSEMGFLHESGRGVPQDLGRARAFYQRGCDAGDAFGCTSAGYLYAFGRGGGRDYEQAVALYQRGCDSGDARGCTNLGALYADGHGVRRDAVMARTLYQRGCDGGNAHGCYDLALIYVRGEGVPRDLPRARLLLERACNGGDTTACGLLQHGKIR